MKVVTIECASWYQREDGFIQVLTVHGKTVILNEVFFKDLVNYRRRNSY